MFNRKLAEVDVRLEEAVAALPGEPADPAELYDRYEMVAIQILDSEAEEYTPGVLEEYLLARLAQIQLCLSVNPDYPESE